MAVHPVYRNHREIVLWFLVKTVFISKLVSGGRQCRIMSWVVGAVEQGLRPPVKGKLGWGYLEKQTIVKQIMRSLVFPGAS